jgi:uncharacterized protein YyaL (SSP411 family)
MTVFLTPAAEPFYAGTYFPPAPRPGMPAFTQVLGAVVESWTKERDKIRSSGAEIVRRLAESTAISGDSADVTADALDAAAAGVREAFDPENGGFGRAPKFPPSMVLEFLLRHEARTGDEDSLRMVSHTCDRMARGGMYDQLGGGFARYSVDATWTVPHFEKMLYDNALLLRVYLHLWRATGDLSARRVAAETAEFLLKDLRTPQGGFASALDADTGGEEGATYVWTQSQLADVLGEQDGAYAAEVFGVSAAGTFEHGTSVLRRPVEPVDPARFERVRARLRDARSVRPQPARDDKIVAAWNGLAIAALAEAGTLLGEPRLLAAAVEAAELLRDLHIVGGRLRRTSRDGRAGPHAGVLEDYGDVAEGFLALHQVTADPQWLSLAGELLEVVLRHFEAPGGGFFDTADDAEALVRRPQDPTDNATPSGASAAAGALLSYAALTGAAEHREAAGRALRAAAPLLRRHARFAGAAAAAGEALLAGPAEVAVIGRPDLEGVARLATSPGAVVVTAGPLTHNRTAAAVYVCRGFVCERPATSVEEVREQLGVRIG